MLVASPAVGAGLPGASDLLHDALDIWLARFWDDDAAMFVDTWNCEFTRLGPYRGVNGNMHAVEAFLAAADVLDDDTLRQRAAAVARRVAFKLAEPTAGATPEHFTAQWQARLGYNHDRPGDQFRSYGATVGHGFEWSRLLLTLEAASTDPAPDLSRAATAPLDRAADDGWAVNGTLGFVYTTDWDGTPVARPAALGRPRGHRRRRAVGPHRRPGLPIPGPAVVGPPRRFPARPQPRLLAPPARPAELARRHRLARQARPPPQRSGTLDPGLPPHPTVSLALQARQPRR